MADAKPKLPPGFEIEAYPGRVDMTVPPRFDQPEAIAQLDLEEVAGLIDALTNAMIEASFMTNHTYPPPRDGSAW